MIYEGKAITVASIEGGIAELKFDLQGDSVNKFNRVTLEDLSAAVEAIKANSDVKGVLVTSGKDCFIVGADITEFGETFKQDEETIAAGTLEANAIFNAIEDLPVPTLTAINGIALGGGFEMCLATDLRVMSEAAKVGLPEVKLGLMPGFGGTVRLPRVIGADNAIEWINKKYDEGHHIQLYTSRGTSSGIDWFDFTLKQIEGWGVKYNGLKLGKPAYDLFVDDRAINNKDWYKKEGIKI